MDILVDENIPAMTVSTLRVQGHDVLDVRGTKDEGLRDTDLWAIAQRERRLFITTDKGFATRREEEHSGILVVRLRKPNRVRIHLGVTFGLAHVAEDQWPGTLLVVRDRAFSVWRRPPENRDDDPKPD